MTYDNPQFDFLKLEEKDYAEIRKNNSWGLALEEFRYAQKKTGRPLSLTEAFILDSLWSDHCSYKSSRNKLKKLVRKNRYVLAGEESDAGAVRIFDSGYCAVFKIESHNHPTLVNPFDGAATGVGGILRDVFAMGAKNIGVGASLRFGPREKTDSPDIMEKAMEGAAFYGKKMSVPLMDLDIYYDESFKHNCLMNVSALGIAESDRLIPNIAGKKSAGYNLIYIGKATAGAAVGGASFASQSFKSGKKREIEFGSNPELEKATFDVFEETVERLREMGLFSEFSFKDMGAAGLTCSTAEQVAPTGYGVEIDTRKVPVPPDTRVHPLALAVGEDQERNMIIASKKATEVIMETFSNNNRFKEYGGKISIIGRVIKRDRFIMTDGSKTYCDLPVSLITGAPAVKYPASRPAVQVFKMDIKKPASIEKKLLEVISSPNVSSKDHVLEKFSESGCLVKSPGENDVPIMAPFNDKDCENRHIGLALVFGGKSAYGKEGFPSEQAYLSTVMARLKLAVSGLKPIAAADGCNYGNPAHPEHYYDFSKGIDGLNRACRIPLYGEDTPLAIVAGNVSLKNTFIKGRQETSVDPSMVPAVLGIIEDYRNAVGNGFKKTDSLLFMAGLRRHEFGGSEYASINRVRGGKPPRITPQTAGKLEYAALDAVGKKLILSSSVIGNGGLAGTLVKMMLAGTGNKGAEIFLEKTGNMRSDYLLFSESAGYIMEVEKEDEKRLRAIYSGYGIELLPIGYTKEKNFTCTLKGEKVFDISLDRIEKYWRKNDNV